MIVSTRLNRPFGAIGVQSGQSPKNNEKRRTAGISPRKPGGRLFRLLYAYE
ncbi:phosphopeptide-binding protein [Lachnoclostridium sp. An138]|nr:phosphopeptide-binding protein [Lachnoclostridium sp. An138]